MQRLLFICSQCRLRSPTAEAVFSQYEGIETLSAGTNNDADPPVSADLIDWADVIFVMERSHRNRITRTFNASLRGKRVVVLGIPDDYEFMDPGLVRLLEARVPRHLRNALRKKTD